MTSENEKPAPDESPNDASSNDAPSGNVSSGNVSSGNVSSGGVSSGGVSSGGRSEFTTSETAELNISQTVISEDDELIVAYLDDELPRDHRRALETRLVDDETLRNRMRQLQAGWDLLEELPDDPSQRDLVRSTMELAVIDATRAMPTVNTSRRTRQATGTIMAVLAALTLGWVAAKWRHFQRLTKQRQDIKLAANLDGFRFGHQVELVRRLTENKDWQEMVAATGLDQAELIQQIEELPEPKLSFRPGTSDSEQELETFISAIDPIDQQILLDRLETLREMPPEEADPLHRLAGRLERIPDATTIQQSLQIYARWRERLSTDERDSIDQLAAEIWGDDHQQASDPYAGDSPSNDSSPNDPYAGDSPSNDSSPNDSRSNDSRSNDSRSNDSSSAASNSDRKSTPPSISPAITTSVAGQAAPNATVDDNLEKLDKLIGTAIDRTMIAMSRASGDALAAETVNVIFTNLQSFFQERRQNSDSQLSRVANTIENFRKRDPFFARQLRRRDFQDFLYIQALFGSRFLRPFRGGMFAVGNGRTDPDGNDIQLKLDDQEYERLYWLLPADDQIRIDQMCGSDIGFQNVVIQLWVDEAIKRNIPSFSGNDTAPEYSKMSDQQRDNIDLLPPEQFFKALSQPKSSIRAPRSNQNRPRPSIRSNSPPPDFLPPDSPPGPPSNDSASRRFEPPESASRDSTSRQPNSRQSAPGARF